MPYRKVDAEENEMPETNHARAQCLRTHAETEMAAFRQATTDVVGQRGLERACRIWLREFESLDRRNENIAKFLRQVTTNAISQLVAELRPQVGDEKLEHSQEAVWLPILMTSR